MILSLLQEVCNKLDKNHFPYMISGSIAMNLYTIPRMTRDIDIVIELTNTRIHELPRYSKTAILTRIPSGTRLRGKECLI